MNRVPPSTRCFFVASCFVLLLVAGCGKPKSFAPVEGVLLLDGQPLTNVLVTFIPEDATSGVPVRSMGVSDDEGKFTLRAETQQPGAVVGKHCVIIEDLAIQKAPRSEDGTVLEMPPKRFPQVYSDPLQTPLRASVQATTPPIELELTSIPRPKNLPSAN